jgi:tetratricopeptide (TPR) repeat protein
LTTVQIRKYMDGLGILNVDPRPAEAGQTVAGVPSFKYHLSIPSGGSKEIRFQMVAGKPGTHEGTIFIITDVDSAETNVKTVVRKTAKAVVAQKRPDSKPGKKPEAKPKIPKSEKETLGRARGLYEAGKASEALALLEEQGLKDSPMYKQISEVAGAQSSADAAAAKGDYETAVKEWQRLAEMTRRGPRIYQEHARSQLSSWKNKARAKADQEMVDGKDALDKEDYARARKSYEEATRLDPEHRLGLHGLEKLRQKAVIQYNLGLAAKLDKRSEDATRYFRQVCDMLSEDEKYHQKAKSELAKLSTETPAQETPAPAE